MPRTISVTREHIFEAAFAIVRGDGADKLSCRAVAEALGCSTQPIYRAYGSMKKLREDVFAQASANPASWPWGTATCDSPRRSPTCIG